MYAILRRLLFLLSTEKAHHLSMHCLMFACRYSWSKRIINRCYEIKNPALQQKLWGLQFKNPVGLGAGFDKNAQYLNGLEALGFGFVEIGTVTPLPQQGNDLPRLFRLPKDEALINRMGFNNDGVACIAQRLRVWKQQQLMREDECPMLIGGNIGKNKQTPNDQAWKDYEVCFKELFDVVDYFVVNVSSPNTPGLRELQEKSALAEIFTRLQAINNTKQHPKPILLKIAPDLSNIQLDDIITLTKEVQIDGLVATNTTISRSSLKTPDEKIKQIGAGGLSGLPLKAASADVLGYLNKQLKGSVPIIASGGIFSGQDALVKKQLGAALVQVWTGFVYRGPGIVKSIGKAWLKGS